MIYDYFLKFITFEFVLPARDLITRELEMRPMDDGVKLTWTGSSFCGQKKERKKLSRWTERQVNTRDNMQHNIWCNYLLYITHCATTDLRRIMVTVVQRAKLIESCTFKQVITEKAKRSIQTLSNGKNIQHWLNFIFLT